MKKVVLLLLISLIIVSCKSSESKTSNTNQTTEISKFQFPKSIGYVNDFENNFTSTQIDSLDTFLTNYEKKTTREIAVITIDSITPYNNIKDYSTDLSNAWGVGKKDKSTGLTIIFSKKLRLVRISTGLSIEHILTDSICQNIINNTMLPHFKANNYYQGITSGIDSLIIKWK